MISILNKKWHRSSNSYGLFLSIDLNGLAQIEQLVAFLYSFNCSWLNRFIGILLARCCLQMVAATKLFSSVISYINLGWFKVSFITPFHVDAAPTWYLFLILGGEGFR